MSEDEERKVLEAFLLEVAQYNAGKRRINEAESAIAELGGLEKILHDNVPPLPPPRPNHAFGTPDYPIAVGTARYACSEQHRPEVHGGRISDVGPLAIRTRRGVLGGVPAWRLDMRRVDTGMSFSHDVVVRAADLLPVRHGAGTPMRFFTGFVSGEWAYVVIDGDLVTAERQPLPEAPFVSLWSLWAALGAAPLERGWSTSVDLYVKVGTFDWRFIPTRLEVSGEERITVQAGTFDCWTVTARGDGEKGRVDDTYWVTRGEHGTRLVARAHDRRMEGTTRFYELVGFDRETE